MERVPANVLTPEVGEQRSDGEESAPDLAPHPATDARMGAPSCTPRECLLLIEDDFMLRAHMSELLMQEGYAVECAADGSEAIKRLSHGPVPAVILLDIVLPRLSGSAFRQMQLRTPSLSAIPTIAVTSLDRSHFEDLQFTAVFKKPIDFDALLGTLERLHTKS